MANAVFQGLIGLRVGMFIWMIAAGLSIVFGVLGILNIAQGSLYMFGGFFAFTFYHLLGLPFGLSIFLAAISVGGISFLLERFAIRPIYGQPLETQLILTFAFVLIFDNTCRYIWGSAFTVPPLPGLLDWNVPVLGRIFPIYNVFIIIAGIAVFFVVWRILDKTWWGRTVRATASDKEMASAIGINTPTVLTTTFIFASIVAAIGGALSIPVSAITSGVGVSTIISAFVVIVVGGLGSLRGAFLGAIIIGLVQAYTMFYIPAAELYAPYLVMCIVLGVQPRGILREGK